MGAGSADAKAMECASGVRTAPMGAGWRWDTLADSASSHHIPSLAPAVALPAPRHDRRRTGAAGSPPGGFPFVEFRYAVVKCCVPGAAQHKRSEVVRCRPGTVRVYGGPGSAPHRSTSFRAAPHPGHTVGRPRAPSRALRLFAMTSASHLSPGPSPPRLSVGEPLATRLRPL